MPLKLSKKKTATATESVQQKNKGEIIAEDIQESQVLVPDFTADSPEILVPMCEVGVDMGYTKNMGNYESARVAVVLKVPCSVAEVDATYQFAKDWVENRVTELVTEIDNS